MGAIQYAKNCNSDSDAPLPMLDEEINDSMGRPRRRRTLVMIDKNYRGTRIAFNGRPLVPRLQSVKHLASRSGSRLWRFSDKFGKNQHCQPLRRARRSLELSFFRGKTVRHRNPAAAGAVGALIGAAPDVDGHRSWVAPLDFLPPHFRSPHACCAGDSQRRSEFYHSAHKRFGEGHMSPGLLIGIERLARRITASKSCCARHYNCARCRAPSRRLRGGGSPRASGDRSISACDPC